MKRMKGILVFFVAMAGIAFGQNKEGVEPGFKEISSIAEKGIQSLDWGLLLETEGYYSKVDGENDSDIFQATVEFKLEAAVTDWLRGNVGLLWEQYSREDDNIDEAFITLGASESIPYYLVAGRFYQPVGSFESVFISDPLTLELIEMNRTAGMIGYGNTWLDVNAGALRGGVDSSYEVDDEGNTNAIDKTTISDFFASARITPVGPLSFGAYWLSDLMTTYNYGQIGDEIATIPGYEKVGAAGAYANVYLGRLTLNAEFASALENSLADDESRPMAFHLEGSLQIHDKVVVGLKYEASEKLYAAYDRAALKFGDKYPGQIYGAVVSYVFHNNASVAAEYLHIEELKEDASGNVVTDQLAFEI
jgi:hypothetical protein